MLSPGRAFPCPAPPARRATKRLVAERQAPAALRDLVLGRKNHHGSRSERGTEVAALLYTLVESCKLAGVNPTTYLRDATYAAIDGDEIPLPHELRTEAG